MNSLKPFFPILLLLLAVSAVSLWLTSCSKSDNGGPVTPPSTTATVAGVVTDAGTTGNPPIAGATVSTSSTNSTTTNGSGAFSLTVPAGSTVTVSVTKSGYSLNQVVVNVTGGATKQLSVNLLTVGATKSVSTASGGSVIDSTSNAKIQLPANFVTGAGNVNVSITGLDPTTSQIKALPGGLQGVDANGNPVYLQPVSFAEYTVRDSNGNVLQFNQSASSGANIELPIPASLRGKPGYTNGDPIECYLYDPTDGKWKTPVPGVVGPSSVDGQPAIKATIFHLSWYGGAPATNKRACITGSVKNDNGTPAAGVQVEAFAGGQATTDNQGHYQLDAAPNSTVRVVATLVQGTTVRTGEVTVYTGDASDTCVSAPDITLGAPQQGTFLVNAFLFKGLEGNTSIQWAIASIELKTPDGTRSAFDSALVTIGTGSQSYTLTPYGGGSYEIISGLTGSGNFSLQSGKDYFIKIDFDRNGTIDANGQVKMVGGVRITAPADSSTVGKMFTAAWQDSGSSEPGYSADYYLDITGDSAGRFFLTQSTSKVIGDGTVDSSIYGYPQPNDPLPAGHYQFNLSGLNGPAGFLQITGPPLPNINGQGVEGYYYSYSSAIPISFTSTGLSASKLLAGKSSAPPVIRSIIESMPPQLRKYVGAHLR